MASQLGIGQDKINQVMKMANKYNGDLSGLKQAINENGGRDTFNKAIKFTENPLVRAGLKKFGVLELVESVKKDLGMTSSVPSGINNNNDIMDRFKNLK